MELQNKCFAVVGGSGFIGSELVLLLSREPVEKIIVFDKRIREDRITAALKTGKVEVKEGDICKPKDVERALHDIDGIFHLAALPINASVHDSRSCFEINVLGTFNVFDAAKNAGVKKVVFSSASSVYGDTNELMDESHPLNANTLYGASKIAGESFLRAFKAMHGPDYIALRYMNVYGPNQDGGLVMAVLKRIQQGLPPVIYGDGGQSFDFVHVRDIVRANVIGMTSDVTGEVFNVGSGVEANVKDVVEMLLDFTGSTLKPIFEVGGQILMQRRVGSSEKAKQLLGYQAEIGLKEGLKSLVDSLTEDRVR